MSYEKQNFQSGQILTAAQLNHIEDGIEKILPAIEAGTEKQLISDTEGNLAWIDTTHGWEIKDVILFPETAVEANITNNKTLFAPEVLVTIGSPITVIFNGVSYKTTANEMIAGSSSTYKIEVPQICRFIVANEQCIYSNSSGKAGTISVLVEQKVYNKIASEYLPIPAISGDGINSIVLNLRKSHFGTGYRSVSANQGKATGLDSFAAGTSRANEAMSFAIGAGSEANGVASFASGGLATANARNSFASGHYTIASSDYQHAEGRYNIEDTENKYAHIIGNGTADLDGANEVRSNAYTLDWSGNGWFAGDVEGKSMIVKSSTEGSNKRFKITVDDNGTISATEIIE